ncbi:IS630 family transposase [Chlorobium sp.]|uniref:IS630 family transposase n=1 Tax=Chlorobium sp. TaxID=1095 RepID=UPI0025BC9EAD|nr:IS630 family transposase [Chlorobium sp.]
MEKIDIRQHSDRERALLRKQVVRLRKQGKSNKEVAELLGLSVQTSSRWWQWYQRDGNAMLAVPKRGRKHGEKRHLSVEQEKQIQKMIVDHYPDQLKLPFALWDRQAVRQLIKLQFGFEMPIRTVGEYLSRWGYTPQKPIRKAYEQRPAEVARWIEESYPAIQTQAKAENAEIYWGNETGLSTQGNLVRGYAPAGKTPELRLNARKEHVSMISAISNRGKLRFMLYDDAMNGKRLIEFMKRLVKDAGRKVMLILDNLRVHHCKPVKEWLTKNIDTIEVFYYTGLFTGIESR